MLPAQNAQQEAARLSALQSYAILDTPAEEAFDHLAVLAARICATPMAVVNFLDSERQWFKAAVGVPFRQTDRAIALCSHALSGSRDPLVVADARQHPLFADNPLVTGEPHVRLYACVPLVTPEGAALGTLAVLDTVPRPLTDEQLEGLKMLAGQAMALLELRRQQHQLSQLEQKRSQLHTSELQYRMLFDEHPHPMWVYAQGNLRLLAVNRAMVAHYGYTEAELLQMDLPALYAPEDRQGLRAQLQGVFQLPRDTSVVRRHAHKNGTLMQMQITAGNISFNGVAARQVLAIDVTERLRSEDDLRRMGRAQRLLSACNAALVRATSETTLLQEICQIAVDIGGYRMGWVGFARNDEHKSIESVAYAGHNDQYLENLQLSWSEASPYGNGPAGVAVRSGKPVIVQDLRTEVSFAGWAKRALANGFHGVICLPLRDREHTFGLLYLYAPEILHISADEAKLLRQLANNLAFGIMSLRARTDQQRLQASVLKMAAAVSASTGTEFFVQLASNMAEALGAQGAFVGRLLPPLQGQAPRAMALATVLDGKQLPTNEYTLAGTPSLLLLSQPQVVVQDNVALHYPEALLLRQLPAQGYAGQQLCNADGEVGGMIFVLFRQPLANPDFVTSTLRIFASRASAEIDRQMSDRRIRQQASLLDKAQDAIIVRDLEHRIIYWNKSAERLYGWSQLQVLGQSIETLLYDDPTPFRRATQATLEHGEWAGEIMHRHRDGSAIDVEGRWTLVKDDAGQAHSVLAINTDIRERKATEREIQRLAFYDALTGLPNRMLLMDRMAQALASAQRRQHGGALLFIDLDNFKTLNDTLGHDQGDLLLQQVATRLNNCVRSVDTVARLGGDEFVVMLEELSQIPEELARDALGVGEKILAMLALPYALKGYQYRSTPSIGIAPFDGAQTSVGELLKQADLAMYQAKNAGRNTLRLFNSDMQAVVTARAALEEDFRTALAQHEFLLHYQPQVNQAGQCVGVEALVRWAHPQRGLVSPAEFIPLAEETGLILTLGRWVLHNACTLLASWQDAPQLSHLTMAVNVSSSQFRHASFVDDVTRMLAVTGAPSGKLKLELTESLLVQDMETTIATMTALGAHGVGFSLDDFGTGYSSLSYLKRMPLNQLKIDQSFVRDLLTDPNDAAIVDTIIALSRSLGLEVIAEGVETPEQRDLLARAGCHLYQGYLFSRPLPTNLLEAFLRSDAP
jgi:diguanylate cyclase (GGDEF)-like protein/PAS domain S-box-containing protein